MPNASTEEKNTSDVVEIQTLNTIEWEIVHIVQNQLQKSRNR